MASPTRASSPLPPTLLCVLLLRSEIDLHGRSVVEARAAVLCALSMLQAAHQQGGDESPALLLGLTIITGRGGNSPGGHGVLRAHVLHLLGEELGIQLAAAAHSSGGGAAAAPASEQPGSSSGSMGCGDQPTGGQEGNEGRVHVSREALLSWLCGRAAESVPPALAALPAPTGDPP